MNAHRSSKIKILSAILAGSLIASLALVVIPSGSVEADSPETDPTPPVTQPDGRGIAFLEKAFQRELKAHEKLEGIFDKADKAITQVEKAIQVGRENGKDISALESALYELKDQISEARTTFNEAGDLLTSHTGFDDSGKVTNAREAAKTFRDIARNHRQTRKLMLDTLMDAKEAIREFRQDNRPE